MPKKDYQNLTVKDMNLKIKNDSLVANVIIDGKLMKENLVNMNKTEEWLENQLNVLGFKSKNNLLLVTFDENEKLNIYKKNEKEINLKITNGTVANTGLLEILNGTLKGLLSHFLPHFSLDSCRKELQVLLQSTGLQHPLEPQLIHIRAKQYVVL